jgi:hypothetical protein
LGYNNNKLLPEVLSHAKCPRCNSNDKEATAYVADNYNDEQVAHVVSDYISLIRELMNTALSHTKDKKSLQDEFKRLLKADDLTSRGRYNKRRIYQDLMEGRFSAPYRSS